MSRFLTVGLPVFGFVVQAALVSGCDDLLGARHTEPSSAGSAAASPALPAPPAPPASAAAPVPLPPSPPPPGVSPSVPPAPIPALGSEAKTEDENNSISVFRTVAPATVYVTNKRTVLDFARRAVDVPTGTGSGFIWDSLGHVVTNFHVVENSRKFSVTLYDHRDFDADLVGTDPSKDIAVLKLVGAPEHLQAIRVEHGLELSVGQKTLAIGNPFGLDQTLTTGIVSALGRNVPGAGGVTIRDMVQTDAAINPGNSGGPLLDSSGRLIGMNTVIFSNSGSSAGIGFAVPVRTIARIVPQIIKSGKPDRIGIGIGIDPQQLLERQYRIRGVVVREVPEGSPAARAGLRGIVRTREGMMLGDVIVAIDKEPVNNYDDLYTILDRHQPGDKIKIEVQRGSQRVELETELLLL
jgi:S1-C subfamily serine protease